MQTYPSTLRKTVLADCEQGLPLAEVAARHQVSESWVYQIWRRKKETGEDSARRRGRKPSFHRDQLERLEALARQNPTATLSWLREHLEADVALSTIWLALNRMNLLALRPKTRGRPTRRSVA